MSKFLTISQIEAKIIAEFESLETLEKYEQLIDNAQNLPKMFEKDKIPQNKISNCQSRTWLVLVKNEDQNSIENLENKNFEKLEKSGKFQKNPKSQIPNPNLDLIPNKAFQSLLPNPNFTNKNLSKEDEKLVISPSLGQNNFQNSTQSLIQNSNIVSNLVSNSVSNYAKNSVNNFPKNNSKNFANSQLFFTGFSDSQLVGGLLQLLWRVYNGQNCNEILKTQLTFPKKIGLFELLTMGRQNGFWQIEKQIKNLAKLSLEK